jgi:3-oxoadipate enol-lactonase
VPLYARGWEATLAGVGQLVEERAPVDLCGLSLGALAGLHVAAAAPSSVRRLVVCAGFARLPAHLRAGVRGIAVLAGLVPRRTLHRQLVAQVPEPHRAAALAEIAPLGGRELSRLMWSAAGFELEPTRIAAPTLVLWGAQDRANARLGRALAAVLPDAAAAGLDGAGHVANLDAVEVFDTALHDFLHP